MVMTEGQDYEVAYSDNVNVGTAKVTITGKIEKTFSITPADISKQEVTGLKESYVYTGKAITPEVTVDGLTEGQEYEVAYSDNVNVGSAKVTLAGKGNYAVDREDIQDHASPTHRRESNRLRRKLRWQVPHYHSRRPAGGCQITLRN